MVYTCDRFVGSSSLHLPLTAYYFSGVSLVGFLASVAAIPVASLALTFGLIGLVIGGLGIYRQENSAGCGWNGSGCPNFLGPFLCPATVGFVYIRRPSVVL